MELEVVLMNESMIEKCVDLFIETFSKEPWNDIYESRNQVVDYFKNHLNNNYFTGYVGMIKDQVISLCLGFKKPWINGMEYYIDEFCVSHNVQGQGIGSQFINKIELYIKEIGLNAMILNTQKYFPSYTFYEKNGFKPIDDLIILAK